MAKDNQEPLKLRLGSNETFFADLIFFSSGSGSWFFLSNKIQNKRKSRKNWKKGTFSLHDYWLENCFFFISNGPSSWCNDKCYLFRSSERFIVYSVYKTQINNQPTTELIMVTWRDCVPLLSVYPLIHSKSITFTEDY